MKTLAPISFMLIFSTLLSLFSCESKRQINIKENPAPQVQHQQATPDNFKTVDILSPEPFDDKNAPEELKKKDIFELWQIFFHTFVIPISKDPYLSRVDYESLYQLLKDKNSDFLALLGLIERKISTMNLNQLSFQEKAAFYINAYNYAAIRLVNKGYINQKGKKIDSFLDLSKGANPFEINNRNVLALQQGIISLDTLENRLLKGLFANRPLGHIIDARFHLILSNTTISRPSPLNEAYTPEKLEDQIKRAVSNAFTDKERIAVVKDDKLYLSRFFKWNRKDFEDDQHTLANFAKRYGENLPDFKQVKFLNYSYKINRLNHNTAGGQGADRLPQLPDLQQQNEQEQQANAGPCDNLKGPGIEVIFLCEEVKKGILKGFYSYLNEVEKAQICVYRRSPRDPQDKNNKAKLGLRGHVTELNLKKQTTHRTNILVEGNLSYNQGVYTVRASAGVRTKAVMDIENHTLEVRQTSLIFGKGHRKFSLGCSELQ